MSPLEAALAAEAAGISVVPPRQDGTKAPDCGGWARWQTERAAPDQIQEWYANGRTGVGFVCGAISGGLEVLDFDDRAALVELRTAAAACGLGPLLARVEAGYLEHSPNGAHLLYRCAEVAGNAKLAKRGAKARIETRGQGGYIVVAPSHGSVHARGAYEIVSGGVGSVVTLAPGERHAILTLCRSLDETIAPVEPPRSPSQAGGRPGDDFNTRANWADILVGWTPVGERMGVTSWRRPGKDRGVSATTNYAGSGLLYVFSSSTAFEAERGYSPFSAYALLHHDGDFAAAARRLALDGYGIEVPEQKVDLSLFLASFHGAEHAPMAELMRVPGIVGDLARWMVDAAIRPQPILALGASLAACATILSQRVMTQTGLRTNLYTLGVATTGMGKDSLRNCTRSLFDAAGGSHMIGSSFASGSAVEQALRANPIRLFLTDEVGHLFASLRRKETAGYIHDIVPTLLTVYGAGESVYTCRTFGDPKRNEESTIANPCLSLFCTTVPGNFYSSLTRDQLANGLLSRFLVFESDDPDPMEQRPDKAARTPPPHIVEWAKKWLGDPGIGGDLAPSPTEVRATSEAWRVFDALELELRQKRAEVRAEDQDHGPYTRIKASAMKLALIRACGMGSQEVTEEDARWGADLAWLVVGQFAERVLDKLSDSKTEDDRKRVEKIVRGAGAEGLTRSKLIRRVVWLTARELTEVCGALEEAGTIVVDRAPAGVAGRPATTYRHARCVR